MFITVLKVRKSQKQFFFSSIPPKNQQKKIVIISALACKIGQIKKIFFGFLEELKPRKIASENFWDFLTFTVLLFSVAFTSTCYV